VTCTDSSVRSYEIEAFESCRSLLTGLAYRLLGSRWDAEDVVQDAFLRWARSDRGMVQEPRAFLVTVVTRLARDQQRSARVTRAAAGDCRHLERAATSDPGPVESAELREGVTLSTVRMMRRLSPPERAVFVLREGFELSYDEIATIVRMPNATCRQTFHRACRRLPHDVERFRPSRREQARMLAGLRTASRTGDLEPLIRVLVEDVADWSRSGRRRD
jgi:RNA polymerase sigma-70 factor (ECF subfamily)